MIDFNLHTFTIYNARKTRFYRDSGITHYIASPLAAKGHE